MINKRILAAGLVPVFVLLNSIHMQSQEASVNLVESIGGCELVTDCVAGEICVDIMLGIDIDKDLDSYNIWVDYDGTILSRKLLAPNDNSGQGDNSCVIENGIQDTDLEDATTPSSWRVAGVPGNPYPMQGGIAEAVHTICFQILDETALISNGTEICVGGSQFGVLESTVTYNDGTDDVDIPRTCFTVDDGFTSCVILPVEYLSFTAIADGSFAELNWVTATEINNDYFNIQHSIDGKTWRNVGVVKGGGNTSRESDYNFTHKDTRQGINYYRLEQVDLDGISDVSEIRTVIIESGKVEEVSVYPNPANGEFYMDYSLVGEGHKVIINSVDGRQIKSYNFINGLSMNLQDITPGVYICTLKDEDGLAILSQKLFIVR
jgi:hypothetical protein